LTDAKSGFTTAITRKLKFMTMLLKIILLKISLGLGFGLIILALL
jgi:hypothetical protein